MSESSEIIRIAAKGDGVTASGQHVPSSAPGDIVQPDGTLLRGPHHVDPPCRHFALRQAQGCGGCQLQHVDDAALADFVSGRVAGAAAGQELAVGKVAPAHLSPPRSRRRASLHAVNGGGRPLVGFKESGSHRIVDLGECHILVPELFALVEPIRQLLARRKGRYAVDIELTLVDQGVDCGVKNLTVEGLEETEAMLGFARDNGLARLTLDQGYGTEALWEPEPVTVTLGGTPVGFPAGSFLQATADGEAALVEAAREWLSESTSIVDLFAGLGTFAFSLAKPAKVLAVEAARDAHMACKASAGISGKPVHALHRDLFRNPLMAAELDRFDAVLLDPPRAGAREQVARIAESAVSRVVYISCNPASWARDAKRLAEAGFSLEELRPVGQFRWSTHVELASLFVR